ncbi:hypothetical protein AVEN_236334-1, partial [Araneus ventricosus]
PRQGDGEDEEIYDENGNTTLLDFFNLTNTKQYIREDRTVPTVYPEKYVRNSLLNNLIALITVISLLTFFVIFNVYVTIRIKYFNKCSANENSLSSLERFPRVHRSYQQSNFCPEVQRLPTGRNSSPDSRREFYGELLRTDLFSELYSNFGSADTTGVAISYTNSASSASSHGRGEADDTVLNIPLETVILNDLNNPPSKLFPLFKNDIEPFLQNTFH